MQTWLLKVDRLTKSFEGFIALANVSFCVGPADIVGIMGPNGSGKTVLFDLICGHLKPDAGEIYWRDLETRLRDVPPHRRRDLGIARTYQNLKLFDSLTVLENCLVGVGPQPPCEALLHAALWSAGRRKEEAQRGQALSSLHVFQERLEGYLEEPCLHLSYANRRRLELARALSSHPELILLDEPTAGMNPHEALELQSIIARLRKKGYAFLIIEHKLFFLEDLADRLIVLSNGKRIAEGPVEEIRSNPEVISTYLGNANAPSD